MCVIALHVSAYIKQFDQLENKLSLCRHEKIKCIYISAWASDVVCSTIPGNAKASVRGTDSKQFHAFFVCLFHEPQSNANQTDDADGWLKLRSILFPLLPFPKDNGRGQSVLCSMERKINI